MAAFDFATVTEFAADWLVNLLYFLPISSLTLLYRSARLRAASLLRPIVDYCGSLPSYLSQ